MIKTDVPHHIIGELIILGDEDHIKSLKNRISLISDKKIGDAFLRAESNQVVLEEKAKKMNYEMPISTVLNEKIEQIKEELKQKDLENEHKQFPFDCKQVYKIGRVIDSMKKIVLYDRMGNVIEKEESDKNDKLSNDFKRNDLSGDF